MNQLGLGVTFSLNDAASGPMAATMGQMGRFDSMASRTAASVNRSGNAFMAGMQLFGMGAGILFGFDTATGAVSRFTDAVGQIHTIVDETAFSTDQVKKATDGLATTYGINALQQADGLYQTLSAGITDTTKATDLLTVANKFAVGGKTDLVSGVSVLTSALNTYADSNLTAQEASDALFIAIAAGQTTAPELAHSLGEVAPTAHALGVSFDELTGAIAALTVQGIHTPQAITGLSAVLSNIAKPSAEAAKEAARLGIEFNITALKAMGFSKFLGQLSNNAKVNDNTFSNLFGSIDGFKVASALAANGGSKFNEVLGQMEGKLNATDKAAAVMMQGLAHTERIFDAMFGADGVVTRAIGESIEPFKTSILGFANRIGRAFLDLSPRVRDLLVQIVAGTGAVLTAAGGILVVGGSVGYLVTQLQALGIGAAAFGWVAVGIAAIGLAIAAYKANLGGFADFVDGAYQRVALAWSAITQLFTQGGFSGETMEKLGADEGLKNFVIRVYVFANKIVDFFKGIGTGVSEGLEKIAPVFTVLSMAFERLGAALGITGENADVLSNAFDLSEAQSNGESFGNGIAKVIGVVATVLSAVIDIGSSFIETWSGMSDVTGPFTNGLSMLGDTVVQLLTDMGLMNGAAGSTGEIFQAIGSGAARVLHDAVKMIGIAFQAVAGVVSGAGEMIGGVITTISSLLRGDFSGAWDGVKRIMVGSLNAVTAVVYGILGLIASVIDKLAFLAGYETDFAGSIDKLRATDPGFASYLPYDAPRPTENTAEMSPERAQAMADAEYRRAHWNDVTDPSKVDLLREQRIADAIAMQGVGPLAAYYGAPAAVESVATQASLVSGAVNQSQPDIDGLNQSIAGLKAAKEAGTKFEGKVVLDNGEEVGRWVSASVRRGDASSGEPVGYVE